MRFFKPKGWWGSRPTIPVLVLGAASAACLIAAGIAGIASLQNSADSSAHSASAPRTMDGKVVEHDPVITASPPPTIAPTPAPAPDPVPATGEQFSLPAVGLTVPLSPLSAQDGQITPPGYQSAYWITNMGVPLSRGTQGTVFVVMHSVRGGGVAPGNYLINVRSGTSAVPNGSVIDVGGVAYRVTGWKTILKGGLAADAEVWASTPGRLVVITCLQHPNGSPSTDNMVITAVRV